MDKISIDNIFGNYTESNDNTLNVNNICKNNKKKNKKKHILDLNKIREKIQYEKKLVADEYKKKYKICVNRIVIANEIGKTNIIYNIYNDAQLIKNFTCKDCITYINKKLTDKKFSTCILSDTSILISWSDIYKNIE